MMRTVTVFALGLSLCVAANSVGKEYGLKLGSPDLKSAGPLAFGPDGILFVGDPTGAAVFAIETGDTSGNPAGVKLNIEGINEKIAGMLGTTASYILINDLAVNPASGNVYLSVSRGRGPDAAAVLLRVDTSEKIAEVSLKQVKFDKAELSNAPAPGGTGRRNRRRESITDMALIDGRLFIAGLSNEEFASKLRSIPFPFEAADGGTSVEIYHGAHGQFETRSPVRTFVKFDIDNQPHLLAAYTCTPLVKFPVSALKPGVKLMGTTIAELGNRNRPLDMVVYNKDGKDYILMANSSRGVMKVTTEDIDIIEGITERVGGGGTAGLTYDTIAHLKGVVQLDRLNDDSALILVQTDSGAANLQTVAFP